MAWDDNDKNKGPWGQRPNSNQTPPDLEDLLKKGQEKIRQLFPSDWGGNKIILVLLLACLVLWLGSGFYRVREGEQAVVLRFGKWVDTRFAGLQYHLPYPIETVIVKYVDRINTIESGEGVAPLMTEERMSRIAVGGVSMDKLMLTGDQNIIDINFNILWFIKDLGKFLFQARSPEQTIKLAAESVVREIIAQSKLAEALTTRRGDIEISTKKILQKIIDDYDMGITIQNVKLQNVDPPAPVRDAFRDVQKAMADQQREVEKAKADRNTIIPSAEAKAIRIKKSAEAYAQEVIDRATGEAARFDSVYREYVRAPIVTERRMYLETLAKVLSQSEKIILEDQGVLPHLSLKDFGKNTQLEQGQNHEK